MALEYDSEIMYGEYRLTKEQVKACKSVYSSFRKAAKLGVQFWDMYGTLSAYNGNKFRSLHMEDIGEKCIQIINSDANELIYSEILNNFQAGCSDDDVFAEIK